MPDFATILPPYDLLALASLVLSWVVYTRWADGEGARSRPMAQVLHQYRVNWMRRMLERDNRMADVQIVSAYGRTGSLFASTTILIVAGVVTIFGAVDKAREAVSGLSFAVDASREL